MDEDIQVKAQRAIRKKKYKELLDEGGQMNVRAESSDVIETLQGILRIVDASNVLQCEGRIKDRAENASEVLMDAQVLKVCHENLAVAIQQMGNNEFCDEEFANNLNALLLSDNTAAENYDPICKIAIPLFKMTKYKISMLGTFIHDPVVIEKVVKERKQRQKTELGELKKPEAVNKLKKEEKGAQKLNLILRQITKLYIERGQQAVPYYEMITDPQDFMNTVDNAFQISFLVRDGTIVLEISDDGEPLIRPLTPQEKSQASQVTENVQAILGLNPRKWKEMINKYQIVEPLLIINREVFDTKSDGEDEETDDDDSD